MPTMTPRAIAIPPMSNILRAFLKIFVFRIFALKKPRINKATKLAMIDCQNALRLL
jgi:hypothetical protein